jgi:hypothetical protein
MVNTSISFSGGRTSLPHQANSDAPPNSLKDLDANSKVKTTEKEVGVCSLSHSTWGVKGACWSFGMGNRTNSQAKVQDEINLYNQERGRLVQMNGSVVTDLVGQFQAQASHGLQPLGGGTTPLPIIYSMPLCGDYIQMALFPETPKWESQN